MAATPDTPEPDALGPADDHLETLVGATVVQGGLAGTRTNTTVHTHSTQACDNRPCPLHNPSDHPLADAPMVFRADKHFLVERTCRHGIGHPDPDSVAYFERNNLDGFGIHGCDGCCTTSNAANAT